MRNKLIVLFSITIFGLNVDSNCSEINSNQNVCVDQNNNIIHCLYYNICENQYYKIDENNKKQAYLPKNGDIILDLFSDHNGGFYVYDKYGVEYKYSPKNFQFIQSDKFKLHIVYEHNNIMTLRNYFYINTKQINDNSVMNYSSTTLKNSTKNNDNTTNNSVSM